MTQLASPPLMYPYLAGTAASAMYSEVGEKDSAQAAEERRAAAPGALGLPPPRSLEMPAGSWYRQYIDNLVNRIKYHFILGRQ